MPDGAIKDTLQLHYGNIEPIGTLWNDSYIALKEIGESQPVLMNSRADRLTNLAAVVFIIFLFLLTFSRIAQGIRATFNSVISLKRLYEIENHLAVRTSRNTIMVVFGFVMAVILSNIIDDILSATGREATGKPVWMLCSTILLAFLLYYFLRETATRVLCWVNRCSTFKYVNGFFYTHLILLETITLPFLLIFRVGVNGIPPLLAYYTAIVAIAVSLLFFLRGYQVIISKGFSHSFWFLYLCTLEILPVVLIVHLLQNVS